MVHFVCITYLHILELRTILSNESTFFDAVSGFQEFVKKPSSSEGHNLFQSWTETILDSRAPSTKAAEEK